MGKQMPPAVRGLGRDRPTDTRGAAGHAPRCQHVWALSCWLQLGLGRGRHQPVQINFPPLNCMFSCGSSAPARLASRNTELPPSATDDALSAGARLRASCMRSLGGRSLGPSLVFALGILRAGCRGRQRWCRPRACKLSPLSLQNRT